MEMTVRSTNEIVDYEDRGQPVQARIWEGATTDGVPVRVFINRVQPLRSHPSFDAELLEMAPPTGPGGILLAFPELRAHVAPLGILPVPGGELTRLVLDVSLRDFQDLIAAVGQMQLQPDFSFACLLPGEGNLLGRLVAETCRFWLGHHR